MLATHIPARPLHGPGSRVALRVHAPVAAPTWPAVLRAYRQHGGLAGGDDVAARLRGSVEQPVSTLARWIVAREVVVLQEESVLLLPLFQFDFAAAHVVPAVRAVLSELRPVFDDWELASWFTTPNRLLGTASPVQALGRDPAAVIDAARIDRFIAAG